MTIPTVGLGIDIGGTKIAVALVSATGVVVASAFAPTPATAGPDAVLETAIRTAEELLESHPEVAPVGCGLGTAGVIDQFGTVVAATDILPGWAGTPLTQCVEEALRLPVVVRNDVHAAAEAELVVGVAQGLRRGLIVAVGTGVGGALIIDGMVDPGPGGLAGSIGHGPASLHGQTSRRCSCGIPDHVEAHASGPAVAARYADLAGLCEVPDLRAVVARIEYDDPDAHVALQDGGRVLGRALASAVATIDLQAVVVCGRVVAGAPIYVAAIREELASSTMPSTVFEGLRVSHLDGLSGVVGAGLLGALPRRP